GLRGWTEWVIEKFLMLNGALAVAIIVLIFGFLLGQGWFAFSEKREPASQKLADQYTAYVKEHPEVLDADAGHVNDLLSDEYLQLGKMHYDALQTGSGDVLIKSPVEPSEYLGEEVEDSHFDTETEEFTTTKSYQRMWQPNSDNPKYSIVPLLAGSLAVAVPATLIAMLLGLGAAIYLSEIAPRKFREIAKPMIELLAGIPTVVLGFLLVMVLATPLKDVFHLPQRFNGLLGALGVALVIIPVVATIAEDALRAVPIEIRQGSLALGATRWQTLVRAVIPSAISGITAAVILGFGRALGETMIVLMATGNAAVVTINPLVSVRTMTATIAAELGAVDRGGNWFYSLFIVGSVLFTITFIFNALAELVVQRMRTALRGSADM
ncbi:MAG: phosphate ABC transporter permease subunit PstC, partial [bacterium]